MTGKSQQSQRVVLLVEDDVDLRRLYRAALSLDGFVVDEAGDGLHALRWIEQRRPDLIVLDLGLPTVDGLAVQQEIAGSALTRDIPILVVTGSTADLGSLAVFCILRKPVTPDELVAEVHRCLHSGAAS
jgi:DNA-binding response OmpR family regulator